MAAFTRIRAFGLWVAGGALLASEMELFDAHQEKALNAAEGGVWAPTSVIEIGGQGIKITGSFWSTGAFRVDGTADLNGNLEVSGTSALSGAVSMQSTLDVQGAVSFDATLYVEGETEIHADLLVSGGGSLSVSGDATVQGVSDLQGDVDVGGALEVDGAATMNTTLSVLGASQFAGVMTLLGVVTLQQPLNPTGSGRVRKKVALGADADTTYSASSAQHIHVVGLSSTTRTYTLDTVGAADGDTIRFSNAMASKTIVMNVLGGNPMSFNLSSATGSKLWVDLTYISGGWHMTAWLTAP
jgi:cytoskeletal protein CcmA (bactofilin family)